MGDLIGNEATQFKPGNKMAKGGRPKGTKEMHIARLARIHTTEALEVVVNALKDESVEIRLKAAGMILDRGYGKPKEFVELTNDEENPVVFRELPHLDDWLASLLRSRTQAPVTPAIEERPVLSAEVRMLEGGHGAPVDISPVSGSSE